MGVNNEVETPDKEDEAEMSRDTRDDLEYDEAFDEAIDAVIHQVVNEVLENQIESTWRDQVETISNNIMSESQDCTGFQIMEIQVATAEDESSSEEAMKKRKNESGDPSK